MSYQYP